jgi:hypothetical protein
VVAAAASMFGMATPAHAANDPNPYHLPTYLECKKAKSSGEIAGLFPVGRGKLLVVGKVTPCRKPIKTDAFAIGWYSRHDRGVATHGLVPYRQRIHGYFGRAVKLPVGTSRVCLLTAPTKPHDCYRVRVPARPDGTPGVPVVGARIPTVDAILQIYFPICATCW